MLKPDKHGLILVILLILVLMGMLILVELFT